MSRSPADGYPGEYMIDIATRLREEFGDKFAGATTDDPPAEMVLRGVDMIVEGIEQDLARLGVNYDVWYRERWVYDAAHGNSNCQTSKGGGESMYDAAMGVMREQGLPRREGRGAVVRFDRAGRG